MSQSIQIIVRYSSQAYNCRVGKVSASSTSDARTAAKRLADKMFGPSVQAVLFSAADSATHSEVWVCTFDDDMHAWCWATGLIGVSSHIPAGACHFATGPDRALRAIIDVLARHGKGAAGEQRMVPGVPEALTQREAMDALIAFERWAEPRNGKPDSHGVVFGKACRAERSAA